MKNISINIIKKTDTSLHFEFVCGDEKEEAALASIEGIAHFALGRRESDELSVSGFGESSFVLATKTEGLLKGYKYGMAVGVHLYKGDENRHKQANLVYDNMTFDSVLDLDSIKIYYNIIEGKLNVLIYKEDNLIYNS